VGVAPDEDAFDEVEGRKVYVRMGSELAAILEEKDADPIRVETLSPEQTPIAAADWQLEAWGLTVTDVVLKQEKRVWAIPPGENGWLDRINGYLMDQRENIEARIQEAAR
jgi:polar amino acid transport system substrate-binding protein